MKSNKKAIIFIIGVLLVFALIVYIISKDDNSSSNNNSNSNITNPSTNNNSNDLLNTTITKLTNRNEYFTISNIMNDYYDAVYIKDIDKTYDLLSSSYIKKYNITKSNLDKYVDMEYVGPIYTINSVYYNEDSIITYYFINGYLEDVSVIDDSSTYYDNINYLIRLNKRTKHYDIEPLNSSNIDNIVANYSLEEIDLTKNTYQEKRVDDEELIRYYIAKFRDLLYLNPTKAYDMLSDNTKDKYGSLATFESMIESIYNSLSSNIFSYATEEDIYTIKMNEEKNIKIYENGIMDFKIEF